MMMNLLANMKDGVIMIKRKVFEIVGDILWVVCGVASVVGLSLLFAMILASMVRGLGL